MKNLKIKSLMTAALVSAFVIGCKDEDFDNYKIQSVDNHGEDQNMVSVAAAATSNTGFAAHAVDAALDATDVALIPVVLTANGPAKEDIHVQMELDQEALDAYNEENETDYIVPGGEGTPSFSLVDNGVVTIPKGSDRGFLKVNTVTNNYFGSQIYVFPYKIVSVQEAGYSISGNHASGIVALIPKNQYDGLYHAVGELKGHATVGGPIDFAGWVFTTVDEHTVKFNTIYGKNGLFGVVFQATVDPATNLVTVTQADEGTVPVAFADADNHYDPATKSFHLHYGWGTRDEKVVATFTGPR